MSVITLNCPTCGKSLKVKPEAAGKKVRCPGSGCSTTMDVPTSTAASTGIRAHAMILIGAAFAVIAAVLTVRELQLAPGWIVSILLIGFVVVCEFAGPFKTGVLAIFTAVGLSTPVLFFLMDRRNDQRELAFYIAIATFLAGSCYTIVRNYGTWSQFDIASIAKRQLNWTSGIMWFALIASSVAFSWATYYRFVAVFGEDELIVRRFAFTMFFVVVGVTCTLLGRNSPVPFLTVMGLTYMAIGVLKALAYDVSKTDGALRIGVFAGCGVVLLLGGFLMKKPARIRTDAEAEYAAVIEE